LTSAQIMAEKLPARCIHQFYPLDHPEWTNRFLSYWRPNLILWMESELWPNMLLQIKDKQIPVILVNGRLSRHSYRMWRFAKVFAADILGTFTKILCQTSQDALFYAELGAREDRITVTDNIKFSANPLGFNKDDLQKLAVHTYGRPLWVYASTHKGEEDIACRVHQILKAVIPETLTIIVPRHPERRDEIATTCGKYPDLQICFRGTEKTIPTRDDDLYIADTLSELGLFFRLAQVACIGRSFSDDGGGGHNPIEAAQLGCAVLHGPNVQNLQDVFDTMNIEGAALRMTNEVQLGSMLQDLLTNPSQLKTLQDKALSFARSKTDVVHVVMTEINAVIAAKTTWVDYDSNIIPFKKPW
jgi:3-deoxy-D-manno-octulosonic-acid transferase